MNHNLGNYFNSIFRNTKFRQAGLLFSVNIIGIPIGIVTSVVITRYLGPQQYGDYNLINGIFEFAIIIFSLGIFHAGNRALVLNSDKDKAREYYGGVFVLMGFVFILMSIALVVYGFIDPNLQSKGLVTTFFILIPFGWVFLFTRYFEVLFQADNRIVLLAKVRLLPKLGFLLSAIVIYFFIYNKSNSSILVVWGFYLVTEIIVYAYVIFKLKISFKNLKERIVELIRFNKSYGFDVYTGSVISLGFAQLTGIFISYYGKDNSGVGFFNLATTLAMPLSFIPNTIATTHYKEFSTKKFIPRKVFTLTIAISVFALISLLLIVGPFVRLFYGVDFAPVITLNFIISFGIIFHGFADFFNRFLGSHGKGKMLRNSSILVGFSTLVLNVILISYFDETGAAYSRMLTGIIYFSTMVFYYFKYIKREIV